MRWPGLALVALVLWAAPAWAGDPPAPVRLDLAEAVRLDLAEAVRLAVDTSPRLRGQQSRVAEAGYRVDEAYVPAYPTLRLDSSYTRIEPRVVVPFARPPIEVVANDNYNATLQLQQALYTFGRLEWGTEAAELSRRSAEADLESTRRGVVEEAVLLYRECLTMDAQVLVAVETLEARRTQLADSENLVEQGVAAPFDVIRNRSDVLEAEQGLLRARRRRELAFQRLAVLLGLPSPPELEEAPMPPAPPGDLQAGLRQALAGRPELAALRFAAESARARARFEAAQDNPLLTMQTDYIRRNATGFSSDWQWDAGVRLSIPLFDGGLAAARTGQAEEAARQVEASLEQAEREVTVEVQSVFQDLQTSWNQVRVAEQNLVELEEARRLAELRYQNGISTNLERQDAEAAYTSGRVGVLRARFEYAASWTRWVRVTASSQEPQDAR